ncbi:hypothetical protein BDV93DRAFT_526115 [Ceratobasidium sp. AG-I]|nr:hypothetical protein BDV93DRAFT_526115 [Ceratobasidium sp. AG-I]
MGHLTVLLRHPPQPLCSSMSTTPDPGSFSSVQRTRGLVGINKLGNLAGTGSPQSSVITTASELAIKPESFDDWAIAAKLNKSIHQNFPFGEDFKVLSDLVQLTNSVPTWIFDKGSSQFSVHRNYFPAEIKELCEDACAVRSQGLLSTADQQRSNLEGDGDDSLSSTHDELSTDLVGAMGTILVLTRHSKNLRNRAEFGPNEAERRLPVDNLLLHLYLDPSTPMAYCLERELKLPKLNVKGVEVQSTKPDALVLLEFDWLQGYESAEDTLREQYSCLRQQTSRLLLRVVHWLVEYKRAASGTNQALMGLVSGLNQRLALGIRDQFVFATIRHAHDQVRVVAAIWKGQMIQVYHLATYSLIYPLDVVRLYLLHRAIKIQGVEYSAQIREKGTLRLGFPAEPSDGFASWWFTPPIQDPLSTSGQSSTSGSLIIATSIGANKNEPHDHGVSDNQGFGNSLLALGEVDDKFKIKHYFKAMDESYVAGEEFSSGIEFEPIDVFGSG